MPYWTPIHDLIFAVMPPVEVRITPTGALCVLLITVGVIGELLQWRRH